MRRLQAERTTGTDTQAATGEESPTTGQIFYEASPSKNSEDAPRSHSATASAGARATAKARRTRTGSEQGTGGAARALPTSACHRDFDATLLKKTTALAVPQPPSI